MKTLFLLRHAKSSWSDPSLRDINRPLNGRGRKAAFAMGKFMAGNRLKPDLVISSSSARTRETFSRFVKGLGQDLEVAFTEDLYHSGSGVMLCQVKNAPEHVQSLMLIGHNPGMHDAARRFIGEAEEADLARLDYNLPTGALAQYSFSVETWADVEFGTGRLERLVFPKDL